MANPQRAGAALHLDASLQLERYSGEELVQSVRVTTAADGTLQVASSGRLPRLGQILAWRRKVRAAPRAIGHGIVVAHEGQEVATASPGASWSVKWGTLLRMWLRGRLRTG